MLRRAPYIVSFATFITVVLQAIFSLPAWGGDKEDDGKSHILRQFNVHDDLSYDELTTLDFEPVKPGKSAQSTSSFKDFSPDTEVLDVAEAWVTDLDGHRRLVPPEDIFKRSAPQPSNEPGFNAKQRVTVVFPKVGPGVRIHVVWRIKHKYPGLFGFNFSVGATSSAKVDDLTFIVRVPQSVPLQWHADHGVTTTDVVQNAQRVITASLKNIPALRVGYTTVDYSEFRPRFMVTTLESLGDYGNRIFRQSEKPMDDQTSAKIKGLADTITGDKQGLDAAAAIHDWIRQNIAYTAVYLDPNDGWVEHPVGKILENGFGDCKDQVALMRALLAAKGIRSERAIVWWGYRFSADPVPDAWQFNHVILYLPDFDVFDNPTDKNAAFAALGASLSGKQAVLVAQQSTVVQLPAATPQTFWSKNDSVMMLTADGDIEGKTSMKVSPNEALGFQAAIKKSGAENYLNRILATNNQEGDGKLRVRVAKNWRGPMRLSANWSSQNAIDMSEPEIYLPLESGFDPNRLIGLAYRIRSDVRVAPLFMEAALSSWQFTYILPEGLHVKHLPAAVHFANKAGKFDSDVTIEGNRIIVKRSFVSNQNITQPNEYPDLRALLVAAVKAGHSHAILQRQKLND